MMQSLEAFGNPGQYPCYSSAPTYMRCGGWKLKLVYKNVTFLYFCVWFADSPFQIKVSCLNKVHFTFLIIFLYPGNKLQICSYSLVNSFIYLPEAPRITVESSSLDERQNTAAKHQGSESLSAGCVLESGCCVGREYESVYSYNRASCKPSQQPKVIVQMTQGVSPSLVIQFLNYCF